MVGLASAIDHSTSVDGQTTTENEWEYTGRVAFGLTAAVGADVALSDRWGLFAELSFMAMSYNPTNAELTVSTKNGADKLGSMTTDEKKINYHDSLTTNENAKSSDGLPSQAPSVSIPFSSVGVAVGLKFRL